jgi:hypothetical protein
MTGLSTFFVAFGFLQPWLLGWLAGATIPILIHLWARQRYRQIPWAAMDFLLAALKANRRRLLLEEWLLLALRVLIVVVLALAAARPFLGQAYVPGKEPEAVHRIVLLDASLSMQASREGRSCFDRAQEELHRLVGFCRSRDRLTLGLMTDTIRWLTPEPLPATGGIFHHLNELKATDSRTDLLAALRQVATRLREVRKHYPSLGAQEVWIFSDLQASTWEPREELHETLLREVLGSILEEASIRMVDVGLADGQNLAITEVQLNRWPVLMGDTVEFTATIKSFGETPRSSLHGIVRLDGHVVSKHILTISPNSEALLRFSHRFLTPGEHMLEVSVENHGDSLRADDRSWISVPVGTALRVLCIDGRPSLVPLQGAAGYLTVALNPGGPTSPIYVDRRAITALGEVDLDSYDCLILCDLPELSPEEASRIRRFVHSGKGLIVFLGPQVVPAAYNTVLGQGEKPEEVLLPARLTQPVHHDPQYRLDPLGYSHPIVAAFRDFERAGLVTTPVDSYWAFEDLKTLGGRIVLALGNGNPLIVEKHFGRGRVVLVGTSADSSWTLLPKWPSFVPLVHETVRYSTAGRFFRRNVRLGECFEGLLSAEWAGTELQIWTPQQQRELIRVESDSEASLWQFCPREFAGVYRVEAPGGRPELYVADRDPNESDLTKINPERWKNRLGNPGKLVVDSSVEALIRLPSVPPAGIQEIASNLLYALIMLLIAESGLSFYLSRHSIRRPR